MRANDVEQRNAAISLRHLDLFAEVGRCGSILRAAALCGLSQPAATHAMARLQDRIGVPLLQRSPQGTRLTAAGRSLHGAVEPLLGEMAAVAIALNPAGDGTNLRRASIAQLRLLAAVLRTGTVEEGGAALSLSQGAARRSARTLEAQLGISFRRTAEGTCLAEAAETAVRRLCWLWQGIGGAIADAQARHAAAANAIVVGAAQAFGNRLLARVLAELSQAHADARIVVLRESPAELVGRLRAGEVDLVVGTVDDLAPDLVCERLVATPYFVFARPGHPLSRAETITVSELAGYEWVGGTPSSQREIVREALFAGEPPPRVAFAASEGAMVGHFVAGSDRLALMTEHESRCGGLALARLPFAPIESGQGIDVVRRAADAPSALHRRLVDLLRAHLAPAGAAGLGAGERRAA